MKFIQSRAYRLVSVTVVTALLYQMAVPVVAWALTGGPVSPEFSSFEPVATTNMVNEFTGAFTYNLPVVKIPGPNGGGYALSLSYHSGVSPEEEASWVGYGWTLNPGAIVRNTRGIPDDYRGSPILYWNKVKPNWTVTVGGDIHVEGFSYDFIGASANAALRYNNYKGYGYTLGAGIDADGMMNLGYSVDDGQGSFSVNINPVKILNALKLNEQFYLQSPELQRAVFKQFKETYNGMNALSNMGYSYLMYSFADTRYPTNITEFTGASFKVSIGTEENKSFMPLGGQGSLYGSYSVHANIDSVTEKAYGYMYSSEAGPDDIMDYYVEREDPYTKRDMYLPVPFASADNFSISGEGVGGGFRMFNKHAGYFHPNSKLSSIDIVQLGGEANAGFELGGGLKVKVGFQENSVDGWNGENSDYKFASSAINNGNVFFRMNNDLGGNVIAAASDDPVQASVASSGFVTFKSYQPQINSDIYSTINNGAYSGRSSYIGYSTSIDNLYYSQGDIRNYFQSYNKQATRNSFGGVTQFNSVSEMATTSPDGRRYVYGIPVYSRNEKTLQYGLDGVGTVDAVTNLAHASITPRNAPVVVGQERDEPYASTYLLTEITTPDYLDLGEDGPTDNDFGGWTKFEYVRAAGSTEKRGSGTQWSDTSSPSANAWYRWRSPYNGLRYERNKMSDPTDDMGGVSSGEREVYFLKSIETATHIAVFVTNDPNGVSVKDTTIHGSGEERRDAYEAPHFERSDAAKDTSAAQAPGSYTQRANIQRRLERIELYAKEKGHLGKLIETVHLDYDYSLCKGLPNSYRPSSSDTSGKLTLRRVYFEYNSIVNARIAPYIFGYQYNPASHYDALPSEVKTKYASIISYDTNLTADQQNPSYRAENIDRWGNYQQNGVDRAARLISWVDQTPYSSFDPAAWQLKTIQLPSGGEIDVQYEQNTYSYVQDRPAMTMAHFAGTNTAHSQAYYLAIDSDLAVTPGSTKGKDLLSLIKKRFVDGGEKMSFRMLYPVANGPSPDVGTCNAEYVTGYANVSDAGIDGTGLWVALEGTTSPPNSTPLDVMNGFMHAFRGGLSGVGCDALNAGLPDEGSTVERVYSLLGMVAKVFGIDLPGTVSPSLTDSYVRIPLADSDHVVLAKKGGGCRVKRLLMFDKGAEPGSGGLYGTEYIYERTDGASSGVATNEPSYGRVENSLVGYLAKRADQNSLEKVIAGRDKDQFEGPIGESILPGPSIGYSRVITRNIHTGKTTPGFSITEFYTAKDFPFDGNYTSDGNTGPSVDNTPINEETDWLYIPGIVANYRRANVWATQGYRFTVNNMHGQLRRVATYTGDYTKPQEWVQTQGQEIEYFKPGESVRMMYGSSDFRNEYPGKEMEVTIEGRSVEDINADGSIEFDAGVGFIPIPPPLGPIPVPWTTAFGGINYSEEKLRTHVTVKVIRYPVIQRSMTTMKDGIRHTTENVAFDPASGSPVITRSSDGYASLTLQKSPSGHDRVYQTYSIPAYQKYSCMGQKAFNEKTVIESGTGMVIQKSATKTSHYLTFTFSDPALLCRTLDNFCAGDLIYVYKHELTLFTAIPIGVFHVDKVIGNRVLLQTTSFSYPRVFADSVNVQIVRSGRTNQLTASVESYTTYAAPTP